MRFILKEAETSIVVCSLNTLKEMATILRECPSVRAVILMDLALNSAEVSVSLS